MHKIRKIFRAVSEKTALPTNQPTNRPTNQPTNQPTNYYWFWTNCETFLWISANQEFFSKNPALWLFYLYSALTSWKKWEKSLEPLLRELRYQPTKQPTNYRQHQSYRTWQTLVQQKYFIHTFIHNIIHST